MKSKTILALAFLALGAPPVLAQTNLLTIEFNEDDQEGFELWPSPLAGAESIAEFNTDPALTSGQTTVSITTNTGLSVPGNRGSTNGTPEGYSFQNLYEDLLHAASPTGALTLDFSGLNANQNYLFTLYAWDPGAGDGTDKEWSVTGGTGNPMVASVNFLDPLIDNETFALVYEITTTAEGTFQVTNTDGLPQSAINGFKLDAASAPTALVVTSINYSAFDDMLTLEWASIEGQNYVIKYSTDMTNWDSSVGGIVTGEAGASTSTTIDLSETDVAGSKRLFFRVETAVGGQRSAQDACGTRLPSIPHLIKVAKIFPFVRLRHHRT